jgi:SAM-dependent methyltransferase
MQIIDLIITKGIKHIKRIMPFFSLGRRFTSQEQYAVEQYYREYQGFRSLEACVEQTGFTLEKCSKIKQYLYKKHLLGNYYFKANTPPQSFMRERITKAFPQITNDSLILEVGPGDLPLFPPKEYRNWTGCDPFWDGEAIHFRQMNWAKGRYPQGKMRCGSWENLSETYPNLVGKIDIVAGSHSFEHSSRPISALREAARMLKHGGILALFVPDGFSEDPSNQDPTHTIYVVPGMLEEFFSCVGGFEQIQIEPFRPNADLFVSAIRKRDLI